jgi:hypothetical protein
LPDSLILALYFPVHYAQNVVGSKFFIKAVASYPSGISITLGYDAAGGAVDAASAVFSRSGHTPYSVYPLGGLGTFADSRGTIVIGDLSQLDSQSSGLFQFDLSGSRLEPDCIRPFLRGVMSLQVDNGAELSQKAYGNVRLQAGRNMRITAQLPVGADPIITFDAISGEGLVDACLCQDEALPIKTISGVGPDNNGNIQLLGDDCLEIQTGGNVITIRDLCSRPCCGCEELEAVTEALEAFGDKAATLEKFLTNLEARVTQMDMTVLGSKLNDTGCPSGC